MESSGLAQTTGPGRKGYVAAALLVLFALVTVTVLAILFGRNLPSISPLSTHKLTVHSGDQQALWAQDADADAARCLISSDYQGAEPLDRVAGSVSIGPWQRVAVTSPSLPSGSYDLVCTGQPAPNGRAAPLAPAQIGVSKDPLARGLIVPIVLMFVLGGGGIVLATVVAAVTYLRRAAFRRQM